MEIDDGEYLKYKRVKIIVNCGKIVNIIPRYLQTTTTSYPDLPTPEEMNGMLKLSSNTHPTAQLTVMDKLCNQSIGFKEEIEELEVELKKSMVIQLEHLKKEIKQEIQDSASAAKMNDNLGQLAQQLNQMKEYMSKTVLNLHHRNMHLDITVVNTFRELFESKTLDSNMMWNKVICKDDPIYQFRGRWRQMADRLNYIANYTIRAGLIIPITGSKYADDLRTMAELLIEVMKKMF